MRLDRAWIQSHIPHQGRMCLLDEVVCWDADRITCRSGSHRDIDNPLRARGELGIACGIEYAAQAMAVHGALVAGAGTPDRPAAAVQAVTVAAAGSPAAGFLVGVRDVQFHANRLDDVQDDLVCDVVRVAGDRGTALYEFHLRSGAIPLLSGRATVIFDANERLQL